MKMEHMGMIPYFTGLGWSENGRRELAEFIGEQKPSELKLIWQICFGTDVSDVALLEEQIYTYGSYLKEQDYVGRELFSVLVMGLRFLKQKYRKEEIL